MYFIPIINCGLHSGETPYCYDGTKFATEEECEQWISKMTELGELTNNELGGGIYPLQIVELDKVYRDILTFMSGINCKTTYEILLEASIELAAVEKYDTELDKLRNRIDFHFNNWNENTFDEQVLEGFVLVGELYKALAIHFD